MRLLVTFLLTLSLLAAPIAATSAFAQSNTAFTRLADGFDFPVGKPNGDGYYKARGYRANAHLGEDWNGMKGGDTDLGDPVYCTGNGIVVFSKDVRKGWGNVVIVRHAYLEKGRIAYVDSLYGHLDRIMVREGQQLRRGQQLGTIGSNRGMYPAHLHYEMRKNIEIGINRTAFRRDSTNYHDPTQFILARRTLSGGGRTTQVAMNTFTKAGQADDGDTSHTQQQRQPAVKRGGSFKIDRYGDVQFN